MTAYHGDIALKQMLLARLLRCCVEKKLSFAGSLWDGEKGTPVGCATEANDPLELGRLYGLPDSLCFLIDPLVAEIAAGGRSAEAFVLALFTRIQPGARLDRLASDLMLWMLEDLKNTNEAEALVLAIMTLHDAEARSIAVPSGEWRQVRRQAIALVKAGNDPMAGFLEEASVSARAFPSSLATTAQAWFAIRDPKMAVNWSADDDARQATLTERIAAEKGESDLSLIQSMAIHDPVFADRLHHRLWIEIMQRRLRVDQLADKLMRLLETA